MIQKGLKVSKEVYEKIMAKRGYNGCITVDDVLNYLMGLDEKNEVKEGDK